MSEQAAPSKKSLIFLVITIGFCLMLSAGGVLLYLVYKREQESRVNMDGIWLNRDNMSSESMTIVDENQNTIKIINNNGEEILDVKTRTPFKSTYTKTEPSSGTVTMPNDESNDGGEEEQPIVKTIVKKTTTFTLTSSDGKTGQYEMKQYDTYDDETKSTVRISKINLIKKDVAEEENTEQFCGNRPNIHYKIHHNRRLRYPTPKEHCPGYSYHNNLPIPNNRRPKYCGNCKYSPYPNIW